MHRGFRRYSATVGRIWKIILPLNSSNFSTSDRMDELNLRDPNFFGFEFPIWGYIDIWWSENSQKAPLPFGMYAFHQYYWFTVELFPAGCAQDTRKPSFWLWLWPRYKLPQCFTTAESATHTNFIQSSKRLREQRPKTCFCYRQPWENMSSTSSQASLVFGQMGFSVERVVLRHEDLCLWSWP